VAVKAINPSSQCTHIIEGESYRVKEARERAEELAKKRTAAKAAKKKT
jgi:hypothetical protein